MNMKQSKLKVDSILEYYDNPQLLTARDCFDTLYLCLLYEDTPECKYTAIRISSKRLQDFCMGKKDLRSLFLSPEGDKEYFNVKGADNCFVFTEMSESLVGLVCSCIEVYCTLSNLYK